MNMESKEGEYIQTVTRYGGGDKWQEAGQKVQSNSYVGWVNLEM